MTGCRRVADRTVGRDGGSAQNHDDRHCAGPGGRAKEGAPDKDGVRHTCGRPGPGRSEGHDDAGGESGKEGRQDEVTWLVRVGPGPLFFIASYAAIP